MQAHSLKTKVLAPQGSGLESTNTLDLDKDNSIEQSDIAQKDIVLADALSKARGAASSEDSSATAVAETSSSVTTSSISSSPTASVDQSKDAKLKPEFDSTPESLSEPKPKPESEPVANQHISLDDLLSEGMIKTQNTGESQPALSTLEELCAVEDTTLITSYENSSVAPSSARPVKPSASNEDVSSTKTNDTISQGENTHIHTIKSFDTSTHIVSEPATVSESYSTPIEHTTDIAFAGNATGDTLSPTEDTETDKTTSPVEVNSLSVDVPAAESTENADTACDNADATYGDADAAVSVDGNEEKDEAQSSDEGAHTHSAVDSSYPVSNDVSYGGSDDVSYGGSDDGSEVGAYTESAYEDEPYETYESYEYEEPSLYQSEEQYEGYEGEEGDDYYGEHEPLDDEALDAYEECDEDNLFSSELESDLTLVSSSTKGFDVGLFLRCASPASYIFEISSDGYRHLGLLKGDYVVIKRDVLPEPEHIVVAAIDGKFRLGYFAGKENYLLFNGFVRTKEDEEAIATSAPEPYQANAQAQSTAYLSSLHDYPNQYENQSPNGSPNFNGQSALKQYGIPKGQQASYDFYDANGLYESFASGDGVFGVGGGSSLGNSDVYANNRSYELGMSHQDFGNNNDARPNRMGGDPFCQDGVALANLGTKAAERPNISGNIGAVNSYKREGIYPYSLQGNSSEASGVYGGGFNGSSYSKARAGDGSYGNHNASAYASKIANSNRSRDSFSGVNSMKKHRFTVFGVVVGSFRKCPL